MIYDYTKDNRTFIIKVIRKDNVPYDSATIKGYNDARFVFNTLAADRNNGIVRMIDLETTKSVLMHIDYEGLSEDLVGK